MAGLPAPNDEFARRILARRGFERGEFERRVREPEAHADGGDRGAGPGGSIGPGTRFGPCVVVSLLGAGGMGQVFRARDGTLGREVAVKVLKAGSRESLERFRREAIAASRVQHPHIVRVHAAGEERGLRYLVTELVDGEDLGHLLAREGSLEPRRVAEIGRKVALALAALHEAGIVHRDVKPSNVILDRQGEPRLTDFGIAKLDQPSSLTGSHQFLGTPVYAPPEQFGGGVAGPTADVYALGATLYDLVAGAPPFAGASLFELARAKTCLPPAPSRAGAPLGPALDAVCLRCLDPRPDGRYATALELAQALEDVLEGKVQRLRPRRWRTLLALGGLGALTLAGVVSRGPSGLPAVAPSSVPALVPFAVVLDEPRDGVATVETQIRVSGSVKPAGASSEVTVNGVRVVVRADRFETRLPAAGSRLDVAVEARAGAVRATAIARVPIRPPPWFSALPDDDRPGWPLPEGIAFGAQGCYVNRKDGSVLVFVPAGSFRMGSHVVQELFRTLRSEAPSAVPEHEVRLSAYFVGKYEVTVGQFKAFVAATGRTTTARERRQGFVRDFLAQTLPERSVTYDQPDCAGIPVPDDEPVCQVSWLDAQAYVAWAGLELPTEAQWEKAALWDPRAQKARLYSWGDAEPSASSGKVVNGLDESALRHARSDDAQGYLMGYDDGWTRRAPIGSFPDGASFYGALDMIGNVSEWCQDVADGEFYASSAGAMDPVNLFEHGQRVHRGGSWGARSWWLMGAARATEDESYTQNTIGFRVARVAH